MLHSLCRWIRFNSQLLHISNCQQNTASEGKTAGVLDNTQQLFPTLCSSELLPQAARAPPSHIFPSISPLWGHWGNNFSATPYISLEATLTGAPCCAHRLQSSSSHDTQERGQREPCNYLLSAVCKCKVLLMVWWSNQAPSHTRQLQLQILHHFKEVECPSYMLTWDSDTHKQYLNGSGNRTQVLGHGRERCSTVKGTCGSCEDPGLIHSTHMVAHHLPWLQFQGI